MEESQIEKIQYKVIRTNSQTRKNAIIQTNTDRHREKH